MKLHGKGKTVNLVYRPTVGYTVKSTVNTQTVKVGDVLAESEVQDLIDAGYTVRIRG
jgi:hypothetical protein